MTQVTRALLPVLTASLLSLIPPALSAGEPPSRSPFSRDANRLAYLDGADPREPYHPGAHFPRLTTPQWFGEPGVDAVVILGIDDMSASAPYEAFLRPILERLKRIDGRAPVSIFSNAPTPDDPRLAGWLAEGVSLEVHTLSHPCPILGPAGFDAAENTYHGGVDLLNSIPGNQPAAFRTPCCDSMDSASPRLFAELLQRTNSAGQFLMADSSVAMIFTTNHPAIPAERLTDDHGRPRFTRYVPFEAFTTTIENYPHPYVIGGMLWEFPFVVPSDWEAQNILGKVHPQMLEDWKVALDLVVEREGMMALVFHPHGWCSNEQIVRLIDHAVSTHGSRVRFLTFAEAVQRLTANLLSGQALRAPDGAANGIRLLDLNNDGWLDVVIGNSSLRRTRLWDPAGRRWIDLDFPIRLDGAAAAEARFGVIRDSVVLMQRGDQTSGAWVFSEGGWVSDPSLLAGLPPEVRFASRGIDRGARLRDLDRDGTCELLIANPEQNLAFRRAPDASRWEPMSFALPGAARIVDADGRDDGTRFIDLNDDGHDDLVWSNARGYGVWLFVPEPFLGFDAGWSRRIMQGTRDDPHALPAFVRDGPHRNNGAWFHSRHLWVQNEDTARLPNHVDRRSFRQLVIGNLPEPRSPEASRASIEAPPGFEVRLVAAEPLVQDPIALQWSADGRLWVVEMRDYPLGNDSGGAIKVLDDTDGDGVFDRATEFLSGLPFPTGIMPWRRGMLVSAAPDILYAEDTDGDDRADVRRVLATGFHPGNQQHRFNGFELGLDGMVYGANGDSGGIVRVLATVTGAAPLDGQPVELGSGDFRFDPDTGRFEVIEGQTQFGRHRNDWGTWFGNANWTWGWHYKFPSRYLARNPHLAVRNNWIAIARHPDSHRVFARSEAPPRPNAVGAENHVTAANSLIPFRDDLLGSDWADSVLITDPVYNVVHREVILPDGAAWNSRRARGEEQREFLASSDPFFRPIQARAGPDGALYVADMYRGIIEHPEWIPADFQRHLDVRAGEGMGRIYRVAPANAPARAIPNLARLSTRGLVEALDSPGGWQRDTAMRLLIERRDASALPLLRDVAVRSPNPKARLQALCTLDVLGGTDSSLVEKCLRDAHWAVRAHAIRIAEPILRAPAPAPALLDALFASTADPSPHVLLQLALSLGELRDDPRVAVSLAAIAARLPADSTLHEAILSSALPRLADLVTLVGRDRTLLPLLTRALDVAASADDEAAMIAGVQAALGHADDGSRAEVFSSITRVIRRLARADRLQPGLEASLRRAREQARACVADARAGEEIRAAAVGLLAADPEPADLAAIGALLSAREPMPLQRAALDSLERSGSPEFPALVLPRIPELHAGLAGRALNTLLSRPEWTEALLDAHESDTIRITDVTIRERLLNHPESTLRDRARALLERTRPERDEVLAAFASVQGLRGDPARGRREFEDHCASCHRLGNLGHDVGPDLRALGRPSVDALLVAILDPNRAVVDPYVSAEALTRDGRALHGIIAGETPHTVTLRMAGGAEEVLRRSELTALRRTGRSLMPEGFELALDPRAMADLIAFLVEPGSEP